MLCWSQSQAIFKVSNNWFFSLDRTKMPDSVITSGLSLMGGFVRMAKRTPTYCTG